MTWYKTGTITVTNGSATVSGSGTLWTDVGTLFSGDILYAPDGKLYEILSINSNTGITLTSNYLGSTLSGQAYNIMPIGLLPSALAQQVKTALSAATTASTSAVRFDTNAQGLTGTQQINARTNIAALAAVDVGFGRLSKSVAGGVDVTLSTAEASNQFIELTGTITANINVIVPAAARLFYVYNSTSGAFTVTIKTPSGTGVAVAQGGRAMLECDATNVVNPLTQLVGSLSIIGAVSANEDGAGIKVIKLRSNWAGLIPAVEVSTNHALGFVINGNEYGRFDTSGNFLVNASYVGMKELRLDNPDTTATGYTTQTYLRLGIGGVMVGGLKTTNTALTGLSTRALFLTSEGNYPIAFGINNSASPVALIDTNGTLLVGKTASAATSVGWQVGQSGDFYVTKSASTNADATYYLYSTGAAAYRFYVDMGGTVHATSTSITAISDVSLKKNIRDLETGLTEVMALKPRRYDWKNGDGTNIAGFIAQELETVLPDLVFESQYSETETKKSIKMGDILPTLVKAVQEQQAQLNEGYAMIQALTSQVVALEAR